MCELVVMGIYISDDDVIMMRNAMHSMPYASFRSQTPCLLALATKAMRSSSQEAAGSKAMPAGGV